MSKKEVYENIEKRIGEFKTMFHVLQGKPDSYIFSVVFIKDLFYKNPENQFSEQVIVDSITDGKNDGGIDILLIDPNSEEADDLVVGQGKFQASISKDEIFSAIEKMYRAFKDLEESKYNGFNTKIQSRFAKLYPEISDESKIVFYFYTSASPKRGTNINNIISKVKKDIFDSDKYDVKIYFAKEISNEIKESISIRDSVDEGKINIDKPNNYLEHNDAIIVNASALSLKNLWLANRASLLAKNLRYYIGSKTVDEPIKETIEKNPTMFWYKNNGITIACEDFKIEGPEIKLKKFSIINGGQTTYMIANSNSITTQSDIYLPCKIIKANQGTKEENEDFIYKIAIATNSQKPIKPNDLKANAPEQLQFRQALLSEGVYYPTKRGEKIPKEYKTPKFLNTQLGEVGKLYLTAIFQIPGTSRSKPSVWHTGGYYDKIFNDSKINKNDLARITKELLYINYYYTNNFLSAFETEYKDSPTSQDTLSFARNARTLCMAFVMLVSRYFHKNITNSDLKLLFDSLGKSGDVKYEIFEKNINMIKGIFPKQFKDKTEYDAILYKLFKCIINYGVTSYIAELKNDKLLNATNYLKIDKNYYYILYQNWNAIEECIKGFFSTQTHK